MTPKLNFQITGSSLVLLILVSLVFGGGSGFLASRYLNPGQAALIPTANPAPITKVIEEKRYVEESSTIEAVRKVSPSVLSIVATKDLPIYYQNPLPFFFNDPLLDEMLRRQGVLPSQPGQNKTERRQIGGGTGFIITADGFVVTNRHVVFDRDAEYTALNHDGTEYKVEIVSIDTVLDVAFLRLQTKQGGKVSGLSAVELGDSSQLKVGQHVLAIGNAKAQYENTVTSGIISATGREIVAGDAGGNQQRLAGLLQTDAAINPGNSGGPLINLSGQVIGINTAIDASASGIGFAIPINDVKPLVKSITEQGRIIRPRLGVRFQMLTEATAAELKLPMKYGALLVGDPAKNEFAVLPGSPAAKAGLEQGNVILEVDKEKLSLTHTLQDAITKYKVGDEVPLLVWQKGTEKTIRVKLDEMPTK